MRACPPQSPGGRSRAGFPHALPQAHATAGFTLFEIAIVMLIVGLLAVLTLPVAHRAGRAARSNIYISDLRTFAAAFQQYQASNTSWPADQSNTESIPAGMDGFLRDSNWTRVTPLGGNYDWDNNVVHNGRRLGAVITISDYQGHPVTATEDQLLEIDRKIDDGNLSAGVFQLGYRGFPLYILDENPAASSDSSSSDNSSSPGKSGTPPGQEKDKAKKPDKPPQG